MGIGEAVGDVGVALAVDVRDAEFIADDAGVVVLGDAVSDGSIEGRAGGLGGNWRGGAGCERECADSERKHANGHRGFSL